jgi:hypothetical protein
LSEIKERMKKMEASLKSEMDDLTKRYSREKTDLGSRIQGLESELAESRKHSERYALMSSKFTDPVSNEPFKCPLIQTNGVIRSFSEIIGVWLNESNMCQSNAFRMFQCPVLKNFTMIASFPVLDAFLNMASSMQVDITLPVVFLFKDSTDSWIEFSFHEQLELIARLCDVYSQRSNGTRPPEQRNVSVNGMSFLISMQAAAVHGSTSRFECFGVNNNGGGKVDIKVSFNPEWVHPFVGMDFVSGV